MIVVIGLRLRAKSAFKIADVRYFNRNFFRQVVENRSPLNLPSKKNVAKPIELRKRRHWTIRLVRGAHNIQLISDEQLLNWVKLRIHAQFGHIRPDPREVHAEVPMAGPLMDQPAKASVRFPRGMDVCAGRWRGRGHGRAVEKRYRSTAAFARNHADTCAE